MLAGLQSLCAAAEEVFRTKVMTSTAQAGGLQEPRIKRLRDSIRMLAQPYEHMQQQAQNLNKQHRRSQQRAQAAAANSSSRAPPAGLPGEHMYMHMYMDMHMQA
jgi:hypothetical protein